MSDDALVGVTTASAAVATMRSVTYGITIPFDHVPLAEHRAWFEELVELGYTDVWSSEADGTDAFTPLALAAAWAPTLRLGTAIVPAFTRGPALMAQSVAALAEAAPGRFAFGIGTSSNVIVERWNGLPFDEPYKRTRDMVRFLRQALTGEKVDHDYDTFTVHGFRLGRPPAVVPADPRRRAAARDAATWPGREADGAILNWLAAEDVAKVVRRGGTGQGDRGPPLRVPVRGRRHRAGAGSPARSPPTSTSPVYAAFHDWLGRGPVLQADVGRLEGRRPQGGARRHPRRGGRRPDPARLPRRGPDPGATRYVTPG